jgi:hypothetical protein
MPPGGPSDRSHAEQPNDGARGLRRQPRTRLVLRLHLGAPPVGLERIRPLPRARACARTWRALSDAGGAVGLRVLPRWLLSRVRRSALDSADRPGRAQRDHSVAGVPLRPLLDGSPDRGRRSPAGWRAVLQHGLRLDAVVRRRLHRGLHDGARSRSAATTGAGSRWSVCCRGSRRSSGRTWSSCRSCWRDMQCTTASRGVAWAARRRLSPSPASR